MKLAKEHILDRIIFRKRLQDLGISREKTREKQFGQKKEKINIVKW